jgi:hypothetical protein
MIYRSIAILTKEPVVIRYLLCCRNGHKLETWFRSTADCEFLLTSGETRCPLCERDTALSIPAALRPIRSGELTIARQLRRDTEH